MQYLCDKLTCGCFPAHPFFQPVYAASGLGVSYSTSGDSGLSIMQAGINACKGKSGPSVLVSASAVGFYGTSESQTFKETDASGSDYLAEVPCLGSCLHAANASNQRMPQREIPQRGSLSMQESGPNVDSMLNDAAHTCLAFKSMQHAKSLAAL